MSRQGFFSFGGIILISFLIWIYSTQQEDHSDFNARVKLSMREVGNKLLLANGDSSSLVLPIIELDKDKFQLSFEKHLAILPDSLVDIVVKSFRQSDLPETYRVEILACNNNETVHSFEIKSDDANNIIPCLGRPLNQDCYKIRVKFTHEKSNLLADQPMLYISVLGIFGFLMFGRYKRKKTISSSTAHKDLVSIGSYSYDSGQSKLVRGDKEITLSKKENELLSILVENLNQIVPREELSKRVWEDNGVFVGRSLDTYISKLRKKFSEDLSVYITNIHGVGYKLEVNHN